MTILNAKARVLLFALPLFLTFGSSAQENGRSPVDTSVRVLAVPVLFYTPDTRWGGGAAGVLSFRGEPLRSSITFSFAYTQRKQVLLWFPYQWYSKQGDWRAFGEVGWFRYIFQYFGVGNGYPNDYLEKYTAQFPRLRLSALRRFAPRQYVGLRINMDKYKILESEPMRDIALERVFGAKGGRSSAGGFAWLLDSRDSPFYPHQGWLIDVGITGEHPQATGSDYQYLRFAADMAHYIRLPKGKIIALHAAADLTQGDVPFFLLPSLGGTKKLRGYFDGKFRDSNMALLQSEFRAPLFWRLKAALFSGVGIVWGREGEAARLRPNIGAGLRVEIDRKQQIHARLDYGVGKGSAGFYLTVGEAF
jgi:outer membrane protein assembly factor BamA